jgi:L-cystine transport system permease protein
MNIKPKFIVECLKSAISYIPTTLYITVLVVLIGIVFGIVVAIVRTYRKPVLSQIADGFVIAFKAIPINLVIVLSSIVFVTYFGVFAEFFHLSVSVRDFDRVYIGVFALSLPSIAQMSEFMRGALLSVNKGQYEAGYTVGLSFFQTFRRIVFPQMMTVFIPSLTGIVISLMKASSLVILLGVLDILNGALIYANTSYCYFEAYLAAALVYWGLSLILQLVGKLAEKNLGKYRREVV